MGFNLATIELGATSKIGTGVKVGLRKDGKWPARMKVGISQAMVDKHGWKSGERFTVLIGDGGQHGLVRFKPDPKGNAVLTAWGGAAKHFYVLALGHQEAFVDRTEPAVSCKWEEVDGYIEVVLPAWSSETAPRKQATNGVPLPATGQRNVTASLMGDPPPGRRQMLEQVGRIAAKK